MPGDKAGRWRTWYAEAISLAEERYAPYQRAAGEEEEEEGGPLGGHQAPGPGAEPGLGRSGAGCVARTEQRGHQLAQLRKSTGLTQAQVAAVKGISQARVSQIEHGKVTEVDVAPPG